MCLVVDACARDQQVLEPSHRDQLVRGEARPLQKGAVDANDEPVDRGDRL